MNYTQQEMATFLGQAKGWVNARVNEEVMPRQPIPTMINLGHLTGFRIDEIPGMTTTLFFSRVEMMMNRANFGKTRDGQKLAELRSKRDDLETTMRYVDLRANPNLEHQLEQVKSEITTLARKEAA